MPLSPWRNKPRNGLFVSAHLTTRRLGRADRRSPAMVSARRFGRRPDGVKSGPMNDDQPRCDLGSLKTEHRELDERIKLLLTDSTADQLEIARLKKRKLLLKDQIQRIIDSNIPDIIA
jgi:hypothetical protein